MYLRTAPTRQAGGASRACSAHCQDSRTWRQVAPPGNEKPGGHSRSGSPGKTAELQGHRANRRSRSCRELVAQGVMLLQCRGGLPRGGWILECLGVQFELWAGPRCSRRKSPVAAFFMVARFGRMAGLSSHQSPATVAIVERLSLSQRSVIIRPVGSRATAPERP